MGNDTDVYGTGLTAVLVSGPSNGILSLTNNGGFSYTPTNGFVGTDSFVYQANDGAINLGTAMVSITVNPVTNALVVAITGTVAYYPTNYPSSDLSATGVGNVTMSLTGDTNLSVVTLADGSYGLSGICRPAGPIVSRRARPMIVPLPTVSRGVDLALDSAAHSGRGAGLDSPYKLLAADVNGDGRSRSLIWRLIQRLILGRINQTSRRAYGGLCRPITFSRTRRIRGMRRANRWYTNLVADVTNGDFVAIKLGDVNNSWTAPAGAQSLVAKSAQGSQARRRTRRCRRSLFAVSQQSAQPGQTVTVGVTVSGFSQVTSAQFSLAWDPAVLRYVGTGSYGLRGLSAGSFGTTLTESGKLAFAWYDPEAVGVTLADGTVLFTVSFEVIGKAGSVSAVALAGSPTAQEVSVDFALAAFGAQDGSVAVVGPGVLVSNPVYANGVFRLSVPTEQGRSYILEFTDSLAPANWTALPAVAGDGTVTVLVDPAATNQQRFYRVHVQ